jgi:hypothetical protein
VPTIKKRKINEAARVHQAARRRGASYASTEAPLAGTVAFQAAVVLTLLCVLRALMADAWATPLERVEFESASQRLVSGGLIRGDRIQGYLARPDGAGPFPAVVGLHGCAGMHGTTKQRLADDLKRIRQGSKTSFSPRPATGRLI